MIAWMSPNQASVVDHVCWQSRVDLPQVAMRRKSLCRNYLPARFQRYLGLTGLGSELNVHLKVFTPAAEEPLKGGQHGY